MPDFLFTSDSHVGHANPVGGALRTRRPFSTIEEHDEALVATWNSAVGPEDTVWHLGDFCYRWSETCARSVFQLLARGVGCQLAGIGGAFHVRNRPVVGYSHKKNAGKNS